MLVIRATHVERSDGVEQSEDDVCGALGQEGDFVANPRRGDGFEAREGAVSLRSPRIARY